MTFTLHSISNQSMSALLGWISFSCWLLVYTPQIYENYLRKSGEGVSIYLVIIWMIGDLANLFGTIKQHLLKTMIILSIYYTACDVVLLAQIYYYRRYPSKQAALEPTGYVVQPPLDPEDSRLTSQSQHEQAPLLGSTGDHHAGEIQINQSNRWTSKYLMSKLSCAQKYCSQGVANFVGTYTLILTIGILGWLISQPTDHGKTEILPPTPGEKNGEDWNLTAQIFGWTSAIAYLCSRLPQIFKNRSTKCRGLSLLFFLIGITGNVTYFASILIVDRSFPYILINLSWLVGSGGTIFLDLIVLYQFWIYSHERDSSAVLLLPDNID